MENVVSLRRDNSCDYQPLGLGTVYKGRPPIGGRGGFKIVDENGHGGRGGSGRMDVHFSGHPKYKGDQKSITFDTSKRICS